MKKSYYFFSLLLPFVVCLYACDSNPPTNTNPPTDDKEIISPIKLDTPNVSYSKGVIYWNDVENADKYELSLDDEIIVTYKTTYTLTVGTQKESHKIKVKAISEKTEFLNSTFSETIFFTSFQLPKSKIIELVQDAERTQATITLNEDADYVKVFLNDKFISTIYSNKFTISNTQLIEGYNTLKIYPFSTSSEVSDGQPTSFTLHKNTDYNNVRFSDGKILYTDGNLEREYNTSELQGGPQTIIVRNKDFLSALTQKADIEFSSTGVQLEVYKIATPVIKCELNRYVNPTSFKLSIVLQNFTENEPYSDRVNYGYDYTQIEIYYNYRYNFYDLPAFTSIIEHTFSLREDTHDVRIVLHKKGCISSTPINFYFR